MNKYKTMESVIRYLDACQQQPDLNTLAQNFGMSTTQLHKQFHAWVGITPKAFLQCLTVNRAKSWLREGESVLSAALQSGLSGPGRLHDLCCKLEAASPGEIKAQGQGWCIRYGIVDTVFAPALIAEAPRGICHIHFVLPGEDDPLLALRQAWPKARLLEDQARLQSCGESIFPQPGQYNKADYQPLRLLVRGSAFQVKVWQALLELPFGQIVSYRHLAEVVGRPGAARAVGTAMANNPLAYLIPCHRVIRATGAVGEYHWGVNRKRCMIAWERAQVELARNKDLSLSEA